MATHIHSTPTSAMMKHQTFALPGAVDIDALRGKPTTDIKILIKRHAALAAASDQAEEKLHWLHKQYAPFGTEGEAEIYIRIAEADEGNVIQNMTEYVLNGSNFDNLGEPEQKAQEDIENALALATEEEIDLVLEHAKAQGMRSSFDAAGAESHLLQAVIKELRRRVFPAPSATA